MNNFEKNFEDQKIQFKKKYKKEWDEDLALYTQYLQLAYTALFVETINVKLNALISNTGK